MARADFAEWVGPTRNQGPAMVEQRGLVVHIMAGTYDGSVPWGKNPQSGVSFHFAVRRNGHIGQLVDTMTAAWTQRDGNGRWCSVENEGYLPQALTPEQVEANAQILAWGHRVHGWPLQVAISPTGRGLGHHSMGAENGINWGHSACPGPAIKAQKPLIVARAIEIVNGITEEDGMATIAQSDWEALIWRTEAIINNRAVVVGGPTAGEVNQLAVALAAANDDPISPEQLAELVAAARAGAAEGAAGPTVEEIAAAVNDDAAARLSD